MSDHDSIRALDEPQCMSATVLLPAIRPSAWVRRVASVLVEMEADTDASTVVLSVFDPEQTDERSTVDLDDLAREQSAVRAAKSELADADLDHIVRGVPAPTDTAHAVETAVDQFGVDRIYMYGRRRSPAGKAVFGSTLQHVVTAAGVPVVVVPASMP